MSIYFNIWTGEITDKYEEYRTYMMKKGSTVYLDFNGKLIGFKYDFKIFRKPFLRPLKSYWELKVQEKIKGESDA